MFNIQNIGSGSKRQDIDSILRFLSDIGIEYQIEPGVVGSFCENLEIKNGVIHFDYDKVAVADLLHDSGHLALVLKEYRHLFNGNLYQSFKDYMALVSVLDFEDERAEILMAVYDPQVTAWAWAVGVKLGLNPNDVILNDRYDGDGANIRVLLEISSKSPMPYLGVAQLHGTGYTKKYNHLDKKRNPDTKFFPHFNYWTADEALRSNNMNPKL